MTPVANDAGHPEDRSGLSDSLRLLTGPVVDPQLLVTLASGVLGRNGVRTHCGVTVLPEGRPPETVAATDDVPVRMDWLQHELGQGPLLDAGSGEVVVDDLALEAGWPDFGVMAKAVIGVRSLLTTRHLLDDGHWVALSFYSAAPAAFDAASRSRARLFAKMVPHTVRRVAARVAADVAEEAGGGRIATALSLVMARHRVPPPEAFDLLVQACRETGAGLYDVAVEVAVTGRLPQP